MKMKLGLVLAVIMLCTGAFALEKEPDPKFYIFLCFGQSNMEAGAMPEEQDKGELDKRFQMLTAVDMPRLNRKMGQWYVATLPLNRQGAATDCQKRRVEVEAKCAQAYRHQREGGSEQGRPSGGV